MDNEEITPIPDEPKPTDEPKADVTNTLVDNFKNYAKEYGLDDQEIDALLFAMNGEMDIIKVKFDNDINANNFTVILNKAIDKITEIPKRIGRSITHISETTPNDVLLNISFALLSSGFVSSPSLAILLDSSKLCLIVPFLFATIENSILWPLDSATNEYVGT